MFVNFFIVRFVEYWLCLTIDKCSYLTGLLVVSNDHCRPSVWIVPYNRPLNHIDVNIAPSTFSIQIRSLSARHLA